MSTPTTIAADDAKTLYITDTSPFGARLRLVMAFTGQTVAETPPPGGAGSDAMKAITHFGKMPAIDLGTRVLIESIALMEYLVETAGGSPLMPEDAESRARVRGIMIAHDLHVLGAIWPLFLQIRTGKPDPAIVIPALKAGTTQYDVLTRLFDPTGDFALFGRPTLADLVIVPFAALFARVFPMFGEASPFTALPRLEGWWSAASDVPEIAKCVAVMDAAIVRAFFSK